VRLLEPKECKAPGWDATSAVINHPNGAKDPIVGRILDPAIEGSTAAGSFLRSLLQVYARRLSRGTARRVAGLTGIVAKYRVAREACNASEGAADDAAREAALNKARNSPFSLGAVATGQYATRPSRRELRLVG